MYHKPNGGDRSYLYCRNGLVGSSECGYHSIPYGICEDAVLDQCQRLSVDQVLPKKDAQAKQCRILRQRIQRTQATLQEVEREIQNFVTRIGKTASISIQELCEKEVVARELQKSELEAQLDADERELRTMEHAQRRLADWQSDIASLKEALVSGGVEIRRRLNTHLREFIERIDVFTTGHTERYNDEDGSGDDFGEQMDAAWEESGVHLTGRQLKEHYQFIDWVIARRMTKEGRFLRIHFKPRKPPINANRFSVLHLSDHYCIDVVPSGSLAGDLNTATIKKLRTEFVRSYSARRERG
jgi:hypothetical protein